VTPFFKDKEGVFFKVASFDAFNDIGPAIHYISCCLSEAQKYQRIKFTNFSFYDACQITGHY
jgi:hypothetical protein